MSLILRGTMSCACPPCHQELKLWNSFIEKGHKPGQSCLCTSKISHTGTSSILPQFEYLKTKIPKERWGEIKVTLITPSWYHLRYIDGKAFPKDIYADDEAYFADVAKAYRVELDLLYAGGVRNVQFDDPNLACECSASLKSYMQPLTCVRFLFREDVGWLEDFNIQHKDSR